MTITKHMHSGRREKGKWNILPSRTYMSWQSMRARVSGKHSQSRYYVGVKVHPRWNDFENFLADMGERPEGMSLDRIDRTKDYGPDNCRWANSSTQNLNRRSPNRRFDRYIEINGVSQRIKEWSEQFGINRQTIARRLGLGWSAHDAVFTPLNKYTKHKA